MSFITDFSLKTYIIRSSHYDYKEKSLKNIYIQRKIGEGSYGHVFLIQNDHVIKIFKNSLKEKAILEESNYLLPLNNENRELIFYFKQNNDSSKNFIIKLYGIGLLKNTIIENGHVLDINSYFIILPYCTPFYQNFKYLNKPLLKKNKGMEFTLNIMRRLLEISNYLEKTYNLIHLDIHLNNFMVSKKDGDINDIIMIDFGFFKTNNNPVRKYKFEKKYFVWPDGHIELEYIPSYSICMCGLELLFGRQNLLDHIESKKDINDYIKSIRQAYNKKTSSIFDLGIVKKTNSNHLLNVILAYTTM